MNTLLWKEWREAVRWLPLSTLIIGALVWISRPETGPHAAGFGTSAANTVAVGAAVVAIAFGLLQTLPEQRSEVRGLLLGAPRSRSSVFLSKTLVALAIHLISLILPLAVAVVWLAMVAPQTRAAAPLEWLPSLLAGIACFAFHPATCWAVCRPAAWFGTRAFPLLAGGACILLGQVAVAATSWQQFAIAAGLVALLTLALYFAARHAYLVLTDHPPAGDPQASNAVASLLMLAICVLGLMTAGVVALETTIARPWTTQSLQQDVRVSDEGVVYTTLERNRYLPDAGQSVEVPIYAAPAPRLDVGDPLPSVATPPRWSDQRPLHPFLQLRTLENRGRLFGVYDPGVFWLGGDLAVYDRGGRFLLYGPDSLQLVRSLERPTGQGGKARFDEASVVSIRVDRQNQFFALQSNVMVADRHGAYQLNAAEQQFRILIEHPASTMAIGGTSDAMRLWLTDQGMLIEYALTRQVPDLAGEAETEIPIDLESITIASTTGSPLLTAREVARYELPEPLQIAVDEYGGLHVAQTDEGLIVISKLNWARAVVARFRQPGGAAADVYAIARYRPTEKLTPTVLGSLFVPPAGLAAFGLHATIDRRLSDGRQSERGFQRSSDQVWFAMMGLGVLHALLGGVFTGAACRHRDLSASATWKWTTAGICLGLGTALAVIALYGRVSYDRCSNCDRPARVDRPSCPHCHHAWEPPPPIGIEIFDRTAAAEPPTMVVS